MASEHADMTRKKLFGLSFISQRHLALGFASWREFVFSVCRQKEHDEITMARALRYMIHRGLASGWSTWCHEQQLKLLAMAKMNSVMTQLKCGHLCKALMTWTNVACDSRDTHRLIRLDCHS